MHAVCGGCIADLQGCSMAAVPAEQRLRCCTACMACQVVGAILNATKEVASRCRGMLAGPGAPECKDVTEQFLTGGDALRPGRRPERPRWVQIAHSALLSLSPAGLGQRCPSQHTASANIAHPASLLQGSQLQPDA